MLGNREFLICDVFARRPMEGNQLAVFPRAAGLEPEEMQSLAREMHFSETTFILGAVPSPRGFPVRIFTPAREVPFAGHPTLGTAYVIWDRLLARRAGVVTLDLAVGSVPVEVNAGGRFVMTQQPPRFGAEVPAAAAARVLGLDVGDVDGRCPAQEVSTGLGFVIVPVRGLEAMRRIRLDRAEHDRLIAGLDAKAVLAFCPEVEHRDCTLHVRVFCPYYDVPEDPATGSAGGCLCAWLVRHRYLGDARVDISTEQGIEIGRPSQLFLEGEESAGRITVRVGGSVVEVGRGTMAVGGRV